MIRSIIPLVAVLLFFMEPVLSLFSPLTIGDEFYVLVPRFVIIHLLFIAIFYDSKKALIYGIIFGLLYDMFYIDIIGLYAFLYPLIIFIASAIIKLIYRNIATAIFITLVLISLLEVFSFGFSTIISITTIDFKTFMMNRLLPTVVANLVFILLYALFFHYYLEKKVIVKLKNM